MRINSAASYAAKRAGMQLALDIAGDWRDRVLVELRAWCADQRAQGLTEITLEQFRAVALNVPPAHQCWGSVPSLACKAGILEPMAHPDGSPVMRFAESVRTHRHPVRAWRLPSSFSTAAAGMECATSQDADGAELANQTADDVGVGTRRLSGCEVRA